MRRQPEPTIHIALTVIRNPLILGVESCLFQRLLTRRNLSMTRTDGDEPPRIGPHEGRELDLFRSGVKPVCMFSLPVDFPGDLFPETAFDELVSQGFARKLERLETFQVGGLQSPVRRVLYSRIGQEWRMHALLFLHDTYDELGAGWHPDLDRVIGLLLGYRREDVEEFVRRLTESHICLE